jgi:hypothetical protein
MALAASLPLALSGTESRERRSSEATFLIEVDEVLAGDVGHPQGGRVTTRANPGWA